MLVPSSASAAALEFVGQFGGVIGSGQGEFSNPNDLAVDSNGRVYVADSSNNRIQKFTADGTYIAEFGSIGTGAGQFTNPNAVAIDSAGNAFVADRSNHRVMQFDSAHTFVQGWGWSVDDAGDAFQVCTAASGCEIGTAVDSATDSGGFFSPQAIAVDGDGVVYVSEFAGSQRIQRFSTRPSVGVLGGWGAPGVRESEFARVVGLALDSTPSLFAADRDNNRVQRFNTSGAFLTSFGTVGSAEGQFNTPDDVAVAPDGNVFVADANFRIQKFTPEGSFIESYDSFEPGAGEFRAFRLAFSPDGDLYVLDSKAGENFRILRLREPAGQEPLPDPVLGKSVNVEPVSGTVLVGVPVANTAGGGGGEPSPVKGVVFVPLDEARQITVKSFLDTRRGQVRLTSATKAGGEQSGKFSNGIFQVLQARAGKERGITEARLKGGSFKNCTVTGGGARASGSRRRLSRRAIRRLRGSAKGRYRTRGRHSAATVRGTVWTVTDRCDGTLTKVKRGKVAVRDFRRKRTVIVRAGEKYLARAR